VEQAEALLLELAVADLDVFSRKVEKAVKEATADRARRAPPPRDRGHRSARPGARLRSVQ